MAKKNKKKMNDLHIILAGWLIDGSGAPPVQGMAVEVKDGVIRSLRKALPSDKARPDMIDLLGSHHIHHGCLFPKARSAQR